MGRLAQLRAESGRFSPGDVQHLFDDFSLPSPPSVSNSLAALQRRGLATRVTGRGRTWSITPVGNAMVSELFSDLDLAAIEFESITHGNATFGHTAHPVLPPLLAPPRLLDPLRLFLAQHPFDRNVFGMTRFPDETDQTDPDPVGPALAAAREACRQHGLKFHLASDRAIDDDLWANVAAHMWASKYGIGFFEDRRGRGINYNLTIEVGAMLMTGRRCALLKDTSIDRLPTDLVGRIYKTVDLMEPEAVSRAVHAWLRDDLAFDRCSGCP